MIKINEPQHDVISCRKHKLLILIASMILWYNDGTTTKSPFCSLKIVSDLIVHMIFVFCCCCCLDHWMQDKAFLNTVFHFLQVQMHYFHSYRRVRMAQWADIIYIFFNRKRASRKENELKKRERERVRRTCSPLVLVFLSMFSDFYI